jgi:LysM repeat protein
MIFSKTTSALFGSMLVILLIGICPAHAAPLDSLRTEEIDGKLFVIHQVDQGETLYAISRRYKVSIPNIISYNPSAKLGLEISVLLKIPLANPTIKIDTIGTTTHIVKAKETLFSIAQQYEVDISDIRTLNNLTTNELSIGQTLYIRPAIKSEKAPIVLDTTGKITHILQQGETFYSLSKKYDVSIEQLKTWNKLPGNDLSIGQLLVVGEVAVDQDAQDKEVVATEVPKDTVTSFIPKDAAIDTTATIASSQDLSDTTRTSKHGTNIHGFDEILETGIGELIPGSTENRKYLGLHHTAKIGTIMKVRNEMNDKIVFVRIIGRIPNTGDNKKVLLKISKAAYDSLGIIDPRFRIEVSYMP